MTVSKMVKNLEAFSADFKSYQCTIVDLIEDDGEVPEEQAVIDDQEDQVEDMTERLEDLVKTTDPVIMPHAFDMSDHRPMLRSIIDGGTSQPEIEPGTRPSYKTRELWKRRKRTCACQDRMMKK